MIPENPTLPHTNTCIVETFFQKIQFRNTSPWCGFCLAFSPLVWIRLSSFVCSSVLLLLLLHGCHAVYDATNFSNNFHFGLFRHTPGQSFHFEQRKWNFYRLILIKFVPTCNTARHIIRIRWDDILYSMDLAAAFVGCMQRVIEQQVHLFGGICSHVI